MRNATGQLHIRPSSHAASESVEDEQDFCCFLLCFALLLAGLGALSVVVGGIGLLVWNTGAWSAIIFLGTMFVAMACALITLCPVELLDLRDILKKRHCARISVAMFIFLYHAAYVAGYVYFPGQMEGIWSAESRFRYVQMVCCVWLAFGCYVISSLLCLNIMFVLGLGVRMCWLASLRSLPSWDGVALPYYVWMMLGVFLILNSLMMLTRWIVLTRRRTVLPALILYEISYDVAISLGSVWFLMGFIFLIRTKHTNGSFILSCTGLGVVSLATFVLCFGRERLFKIAFNILTPCRHQLRWHDMTCYWFFLVGVFVVVALILVTTCILFIIEMIKTTEPFDVRCETVKNPLARICFPKVGSHPLFYFAHGDGTGGYLFDLVYHDLQAQIAGSGFVVPAHLSCWFDSHCDNGEGAFLDVLRLIDYVKDHAEHFHLNLSNPFTMSGHSTGARAALMLGAMKDKPAYLDALRAKYQVTPDMLAPLANIGAIVAYHPDPMYEYDLNPDTHDYDITETPVMIFTGTDDDVEPFGSAWNDFQMISTPTKVFVNVRGADHYDDDAVAKEAQFMTDFAQAFALKNASLVGKICGAEEGSLQKSLPLAPPGDANNGVAKNGQRDIAFQCCKSDENGAFSDNGLLRNMWKKSLVDFQDN